MKTIVVCALALVVSTAGANVSPDTVDQLVSFAHAGCDYLHAHTFEPPAPVWPPRKLAAHFGRVVRSAATGETRDYYLAVPQFPDWKVVYEDRIVTLYVPAPLRIEMMQLVKRLGTPQPTDVDVARPADATTATETSDTEWLFPQSADRRSCRLRATTEAEDKPLGERRVLTFSFQD